MHDAISSELQIGVRGGVALAVAACSVVGEAVELNDELPRGPKRVYLVGVLVALNRNVENRAR